MTDEQQQRMRAKRIILRNVMGVEELEFSPGKVTLVTGSNAAGKTSVLEGVRALLGGGYDATLVRAGADEAELVAVLEDNTTVRKRIKASGGGDTTVEHPGFGPRKAPQSWLNEKLDRVSFNPVEFLTAGDDRQMEMILESAAVDLPVERLVEVVDATGLELREDEVDSLGSWDGLTALEYVRKKLFDHRTGTNRALRDKRGTVKDLEVAVEDAPDPAALAQEVQELEAFIREVEAGRESDTEAARQRVHDQYSEKLREVGAELAEVDRELARLEERKRALEERRTDLHNAESLAERQAIQDVRNDADAILGEKRARLEGLREQEKAAQRAAGARERLDQARAGVEALASEADALTDALEALEGIKVEQFRQLPIEGMDLRDGKLYVGEVPLRRLNSAKLLELAFWMAERRAGELGLVVVDGLEALDPDTFQAFTRHAARSDLQFIVTRVGTGELSAEPMEVDGGG